MAERCRRRWPVWGVGLLTLLFLGMQPGGEGRMLRAPSPSAAWVSLHHRLGPRMPELFSQAEIKAIALSAGLREKDMEDVISDDTTRFWLGHLAAGKGLLAYEPHLGATGKSGWVAVTRVGWRQTHLRLLSNAGLLKRWMPEGQHGGRRIWVRRKEGRTPWSVALCEGWLVGVRHNDPSAIHEVLDRMDGCLPSLENHRLDFKRWAQRPDSEPDRGYWLGAPAYPLPVELTLENNPSPRFQFTGPGVASLMSDEPPPETRQLAARLIGPNALAMLSLPPGILSEKGGQLLFADAPYSWVVSWLGLPGLFWVAPASSRADAFSQAQDLMLKIGQLTGMEWVTSESTDGFLTFQPAETKIKTLLTDKQALTALYFEGHLVLAAGRQALEKTLLRFASESSRFEQRDVRWGEDSQVLWVNSGTLLERIEPFYRSGLLTTALANRREDSPEKVARNAAQIEAIWKAWQPLRFIRIERGNRISQPSLVLFFTK